VAYGGGTFVALAYESNIAVYSTDKGKTWQTTAPLPETSTWNKVVYGKGVFVAVAADNALGANEGDTPDKGAWSANGIDWTEFTPPLEDIVDVVYADDYDGGMFIMNCTSGRTVLSSDGKTWTWITGGRMNGSYTGVVIWQAVGYGGGVFLSFDYNGKLVSRSEDGGNTWNVSQVLPINGIQRRRVAYGGGVFVAIGGPYEEIILSGDTGKTWKKAGLSYSGGIAYGKK
jgi:hypothetical protein